MMGPTHCAIGAATALGVCALVTPQATDGAIMVGVALGSSKLPDQLEIFGLRHRGPTHWLLTAAMFCGLVALAAAMIVDTHEYAGAIAAGVTIGYFMHIAADCCTISGVPVLGPFNRADHWLLPRCLRVRTGKLGDGFVALLATVASMCLIFTLAPPAA